MEKQAAEAQERAKQALNEKPSMQMRTESANLKARIGRIEAWLETLLEMLPEHLRGFMQDILCDREPFSQKQRQKRDRDLER